MSINSLKKKNLRFRHLSCFLEVAAERSITKAAENLGTVQPALSRTIRELEQRVGKKLFRRTRDGLVLTDAGEMLHQYTASGMTQIAQGVDRVSDGGMPVIAVGVMPNTLRMVLPRCVQEFKRSHTETSVRIVTGTNPDLHGKLRDETLDFVVGRLLEPRHMEGLQFEHLFDEPLVFAAAANHPIHANGPATFSTINAFPVVMPPARSMMRDDIDRCLIAVGAPGFSNVIETLSAEFACSYAMQGQAIIAFPRWTLGPELESGEMREVAFADVSFMIAMGITSLPGHSLNEPCKKLISLIRDAAVIRALSH